MSLLAQSVPAFHRSASASDKRYFCTGSEFDLGLLKSWSHVLSLGAIEVEEVGMAPCSQFLDRFSVPVLSPNTHAPQYLCHPQTFGHEDSELYLDPHVQGDRGLSWDDHYPYLLLPRNHV